VRSALASDRQGVIDAGIQYTDHYTPTPENVGALFDLALLCEGMFVAEHEGQVVGFLCAIALPHPMTGEFYADVVAWFVLPAWRGSWAAAGLFRKMLRWSSTEALDMVKIARPVNSQIGTVYERAGFAPVEVVYLLKRAHGCRTADHDGGSGARELHQQ